jgi:hypothetical protein
MVTLVQTRHALSLTKKAFSASPKYQQNTLKDKAISPHEVQPK